MVDFNQIIKNEWRVLGFYYDHEKSVDKNEWKFYGSKQGLYNFVKLLEEYINNPTNDFISEHEHYGPYSYLKVMTWPNAMITESYIAGTLIDLKKLKDLISEKLEQTQVGQSFTIDKEYSTNNTASAKFFVMKDNFDPVSMDKNYD